MKESTRASIVEEEENDFLSDFDVAKFFLVLRRSIIWMILLFASSMGIAFMVLRYTKPTYESQSLIKLEQKGGSAILQLGVFKDDNTVSDYIDGEIEFMRSNTVLADLIRNLDLETGYYVKGRINDEEKFGNAPFKVNYEVRNPKFFNQKVNINILNASNFELSYEFGDEKFSEVYRFGQTLNLPHFRAKISNNQNMSLVREGQYYFVMQNILYLQTYLSERLTITVPNIKAKTVSILFQDANRYKATAIVNELMNVYLKKNVAYRNQVNKQTLGYLTQQLDTTYLLMNKYEKEIEDYKRNNFVMDKDLQQKTLDNVLTGIRSLQEAKFKIDNELKSYKEITDLMAVDSSYFLIATLANHYIGDKQIATRLTELENLENDKQRLLKGQTEKTYAYLQRKEALDKAKTDLFRLISFNKTDLYEKIYTLNQEIRKLESQINVESSGTDYELRKLTRYYDNYENNYNTLINKIIDIGIALPPKSVSLPLVILIIPHTPPVSIFNNGLPLNPGLTCPILNFSSL